MYAHAKKIALKNVAARFGSFTSSLLVSVVETTAHHKKLYNYFAWIKTMKILLVVQGL